MNDEFRSPLPSPRPATLSRPPKPAEAAGAVRADRVAMLLRLLGALLLVSAAGTFLVQHWNAGNDVQRYLLLLGQAVVLAGAGVYAGLGLSEPKSARTFLGLVLAVTPVHFGVLAALVYSRFSLDGGSSALRLPQHALWLAPSDAAALGITALGLVVLVPLVLISFTALARGQVARLAVPFLAGNALLLVPTRDSDVVVWLLATGAYAVHRSLAHPELARAGLDTPSGRLARALPYTGPTLLLGRALYLYEPTQLMFGVLGLLLWVVGYVELGRASNLPALRLIGQWLCTLAGVLGWGALVRAFGLDARCPAALRLALDVLPVCLGLLLLARHAVGGAAGPRRLALLVANACMLVELRLWGGATPGALALAVGTASLLYAARLQQVAAALGAVAGLLAGLGVVLSHLVRVPALGHWAALSVFGVALILGASALERRKERLLAYVASARSELSEWSL
jgi:hypothetical protein